MIKHNKITKISTKIKNKNKNVLILILLRPM